MIGEREIQPDYMRRDKHTVFETTEPGYRLVRCEGCGFTYSADHCKDDGTGDYECPICVDADSARSEQA